MLYNKLNCFSKFIKNYKFIMYENVITNIKNSSINCKKLTKEHKNHVPYLNATMLIYIQTNTHI